ncbi:Phosphatidylinositol 4-phosphate 5-kinase [Psidium guajava]|nr:Phosphatidylinositol 4-phosphate 5-kinase [Psidium guajava]
MGPDAAALAAAARQAERLRKDRKECHRRSRFGAAINAYTELPNSSLFNFFTFSK